MRKWILALALAALAVPGLTEEKSTETNFNGQYALEGWGGGALPGVAPEFTYCRTLGQSGDPFGADMQIVGNFGYDTDELTDLNLSGAFRSIGVGDKITLRSQDLTSGFSYETFSTTVTTKATDYLITIGPGLPANIAAWSRIYWRDTQCDTEGGGWVNVLNWESVLFSVRYMSGGSSGGMAFVFECRPRDWANYEPDALWPGIQVYPGSASTCGFGALSTDYCVLATPADTAIRATDSYFGLQVSHTQNFYECRIGLACETDCDAEMYQSSITVNRQEVK